MKRVFKKNQIIITALALMIAVAGYVSYTQSVGSKEKTDAAFPPAKHRRAILERVICRKMYLPIQKITVRTVQMHRRRLQRMPRRTDRTTRRSKILERRYLRTAITEP